MNKLLSICIPSYIMESFLSRCVDSLLIPSLDRLEILIVNDGSKDETWNIISSLNKTNRFVKGVNLACNVGHQNALWAGLTVAVEHADMIVSIDADLQDDVDAIKEMVDKHHEGCDVVYGVRL